MGKKIREKKAIRGEYDYVTGNAPIYLFPFSTIPNTIVRSSLDRGSRKSSSILIISLTNLGYCTVRSFSRRERERERKVKLSFFSNIRESRRVEGSLINDSPDSDTLHRLVSSATWTRYTPGETARPATPAPVTLPQPVPCLASNAAHRKRA